RIYQRIRVTNNKSGNSDILFGKGGSEMKHIFNKGEDETKPTLLLLHGTGGNESDLLPIAKEMDDQANVLSVRGNVLENGMQRFFKRLAEEVFDEGALSIRTKE